MSERDITERLRDWEAGAVGRPPLYDEAATEIERLRNLLAPDITFRDIEMQMRDGSIDLRTVLGAESQPAFRFLAALMLYFVLGENEGDEEPPNYRSGEFTLKPADGFEEITCAIEVVKPGGKSSHQIRTELEAELAAVKATR